MARKRQIKNTTLWGSGVTWIGLYGSKLKKKEQSMHKYHNIKNAQQVLGAFDLKQYNYNMEGKGWLINMTRC